VRPPVAGATNQNFTPGVGTSNYKVEISDVHGCAQTSPNLNVTVFAAPNPAISGNLVVCPGGTTTLSVGTYSTYLWSTGATSPTITAGGGTYTVTVKDGNNCSVTTAPKTVSEVPGPSPVITANGPISFCDGGSVILDAGAGYSSYNWSNGKTTQTITVTTTGNYSVTTTSVGGGCPGTSTPVTVTAWSVPTPTVTSSSGSSTFCNNTGTYLTTVAGFNYQWIKGTANVAGATNQNFTPGTGTSNYKVKISDTHGCNKTSSSLNVTVFAAPSPSISGNLSICGVGSTTLSVGSYSTYLWSNGATTPTINVNTAATYTVTVKDANNCSATTPPKTTTVFPLPTPVITANGPVSFCDGGTVTLDAGSGYSSYSWSNGKNNSNKCYYGIWNIHGNCYQFRRLFRRVIACNGY
jgi:hypothetical protein